MKKADKKANRIPLADRTKKQPTMEILNTLLEILQAVATSKNLQELLALIHHKFATILDVAISRHYIKLASKKGIDDKVFAEGVVFYNLKRKAEGKVYMAKLRRDMFDWFYDKIEILNYNVKGKDEIEDQEKFD